MFVQYFVLAIMLMPSLASSQQAVPPPPRPTDNDPSGGCINIPNISPRIPTLPAGAPCIKLLYTATSPTGTYSLGYVDTNLGTGAPAQPGQTLSIEYTVYLDDGTKLDSSDSLPNKSPASFQYGQHRVIAGWDTGFAGMRVGGKRRLFIPYQLAYGEAGKPPFVPAKCMLISDVELVAVRDASPPGPAVAVPPQQAVPPPPRPVDSSSTTSALASAANNGPSLEVTLAFIKAKIEDLGDLHSYATCDGSDGQPIMMEYPRNVVDVDPAACTIAISQRGSYYRRRQTAKLTDLAKIEIGPQDERIGGSSCHSSPNFPELRVYFSKRSVQVHQINTVPDTSQKVDKKHPQQTIETATDTQEKELFVTFDDADVADRVAKAMTHAVELCGGGNKDPF
jgi:peptidylprolyl isomerase